MLNTLLMFIIVGAIVMVCCPIIFDRVKSRIIRAIIGMYLGAFICMGMVVLMFLN